MADESLDIQIKLLADTYGAEKVQSALKQIKGETEGLTIKHQELRAAVRGLHTEFPELARIAHLALHPIGLAVAAIGGSFAVWKMRTEELQATFANLALPDIKALDVGHINAVTEAWGKYNKALGTAIENAHSVEKDTEKALKSIETRIEATNKLIEAFAGKKQAGASGILEKLGISEQETIDKSIIDKRADNLKLGEKEREIANLGIESVNKRREGAKIRVASAEDDAKTTEALKAAAEIAKKDIDERKQKIGVLRARQAGETLTPAEHLQIVKLLGLGQGADAIPGAIADIQGGIPAAQATVDLYNSRLRGAAGRDAQRATRDRLFSESAAAGAKAEELNAGMPADYRQARDRQGLGSILDVLKRQTETLKALHEAHDQTDKASKEIADAIKSKQTVQASMIKALKDSEAIETALVEHQKRLEMNLKALAAH